MDEHAEKFMMDLARERVEEMRCRVGAISVYQFNATYKADQSAAALLASREKPKSAPLGPGQKGPMWYEMVPARSAAMDDILKIAEEMEKMGPVSWAAFGPQIVARLRAIASPEREAFLKAADEYCDYYLRMTVAHGGCDEFRAMIDAYRAWKEAQRG